MIHCGFKTKKFLRSEETMSGGKGKVDFQNTWGVAAYRKEQDGDKAHDVTPDKFLALFPAEMQPVFITSCASDAMTNLYHLAQVRVEYGRCNAQKDARRNRNSSSSTDSTSTGTSTSNHKHQ